jgi:hypothetical protein
MALHPSAEILNLCTVQRIPAQANFEAVVFGRVVACGDLDTAIKIEMKQRKIQLG